MGYHRINTVTLHQLCDRQPPSSPFEPNPNPERVLEGYEARPKVIMAPPNTDKFKKGLRKAALEAKIAEGSAALAGLGERHSPLAAAKELFCSASLPSLVLPGPGSLTTRHWIAEEFMKSRPAKDYGSAPVSVQVQPLVCHTACCRRAPSHIC